MNQKKIKATAVLIVSAMLLMSQTSQATGNEEGNELFKTYCDACHGMAGGMNMRQRIAPPIAAVRMHYISHYPDQPSFVNAITSWVEHRDPRKSLMRGAIRRFNIMPPISVKKEDSIKIANYIYSGQLDVPQGMREHIQQEHQKNGMRLRP